jgi:hypothetical protein
MFQDEARFGRINDVRRCWAPRPIRPLCQAMLTHEYTYAYASCEPATGTMDALILPQVNTQCMQIFLDTVAERNANDHIVMVMDGAGWHSSKKLVAPSNIRLLALPPYAPELNPVEHLWDELREKCFHNKVFASIDALEDDLEMGLLAMENTPEVIKSITNWPWIINVLSKWK